MRGGVFGLKCRLDLALCLIHNHFHLFLVSSVRSSDSHPEQYFGASSGGGTNFFSDNFMEHVSNSIKGSFCTFQKYISICSPTTASAPT